MDKKDNEFKFSFSAPTKNEREEIEDIRKNYLPMSSRNKKLARLKDLDARVKNIPTIWGLVLGVTGILTFGLGLTITLEWSKFIFGACISLVGAVPMALAYPVYKKSKDKLTNKYREEILKLSEELLNEEK